MNRDDDEIANNAYAFVAMGSRQYKLGELEFPKGGVRHVIPYKGNYEDLR